MANEHDTSKSGAHTPGEELSTQREAPRQRSRRALKPGVCLSESGEYDRFTTMDVLDSLQGVCVALDHSIASQSDIDRVGGLARAAMVLSTILQNRVQQ